VTDAARVVLLQLEAEELEALVRDAVRVELEAREKANDVRTRENGQERKLEPLLTASQLAEILNCGVRTLKRWLQEGVAPPPIETPGSKLRW